MARLPAKWLTDVDNDPQHVAHEKRKNFLILRCQGKSVKQACEAVGYKSSIPIYAYRKTDPEFSLCMDAAAEACRQFRGDNVEDVMYEQGTEGTEEEIYYQGEVVGRKKVYNVAAQQMLLRGLKPDVYRENAQVQVNIGTTGVMAMPAAMASDADWEKLANDLTKTQAAISGPIVDGTAEVISNSPIKRA